MKDKQEIRNIYKELSYGTGTRMNTRNWSELPCLSLYLLLFVDRLGRAFPVLISLDMSSGVPVVETAVGNPLAFDPGASCALSEFFHAGRGLGGFPVLMFIGQVIFSLCCAWVK